jgi:hypothetical protein
MHFDHWWTRAPKLARIAVVLVSVVAMLLGGGAGHYWG